VDGRDKPDHDDSTNRRERPAGDLEAGLVGFGPQQRDGLRQFLEALIPARLAGEQQDGLGDERESRRHRTDRPACRRASHSGSERGRSAVAARAAPAADWAKSAGAGPACGSTGVCGAGAGWTGCGTTWAPAAPAAAGPAAARPEPADWPGLWVGACWAGCAFCAGVAAAGRRGERRALDGGGWRHARLRGGRIGQRRAQEGAR
jgi:hypothetical protein